ncbi:hypothetical protein HDU67_000669 [Dinochytrium kinnereticum]|nr:hypothetical protein HDU67_000669 [Dinochytrium kinnereticum]
MSSRKRKADDAEDETDPFLLEPAAASRAQNRLDELLAGAFDFEEEDEEEKTLSPGEHDNNKDQTEEHAFRLFQSDDSLLVTIRDETKDYDSVMIKRKIEWDSDEENEIRERLESVAVTLKSIIKQNKRFLNIKKRWTKRLEHIPLNPPPLDKEDSPRKSYKDHILAKKAAQSSPPASMPRQPGTKKPPRQSKHKRQRKREALNREKEAPSKPASKIKPKVVVRKTQTGEPAKTAGELAVVYGRMFGWRGVLRGVKGSGSGLIGGYNSSGYGAGGMSSSRGAYGQSGGSRGGYGHSRSLPGSRGGYGQFGGHSSSAGGYGHSRPFSGSRGGYRQSGSQYNKN